MVTKTIGSIKILRTCHHCFLLWALKCYEGLLVSRVMSVGVSLVTRDTWRVTRDELSPADAECAEGADPGGEPPAVPAARRHQHRHLLLRQVTRDTGHGARDTWWSPCQDPADVGHQQQGVHHPVDLLRRQRYQLLCFVHRWGRVSPRVTCPRPDLCCRPVPGGPGGQAAADAGLLRRHPGLAPAAGRGLHPLRVTIH